MTCFRPRIESGVTGLGRAEWRRGERPEDLGHEPEGQRVDIVDLVDEVDFVDSSGAVDEVDLVDRVDLTDFVGGSACGNCGVVLGPAGPPGPLSPRWRWHHWATASAVVQRASISFWRRGSLRSHRGRLRWRRKSS